LARQNLGEDDSVLGEGSQQLDGHLSWGANAGLGKRREKERPLAKRKYGVLSRMMLKGGIVIRWTKLDNGLNFMWGKESRAMRGGEKSFGKQKPGLRRTPAEPRRGY